MTDTVKPTLEEVASAAEFNAQVFAPHATVYVALHRGAAAEELLPVELAARALSRSLRGLQSAKFVSVACSDVPSACLLAPRDGDSSVMLVAAQRIPFVEGSGADATDFFSEGGNRPALAGADDGGFVTAARDDAPEKPIVGYTGDAGDTDAVLQWMTSVHHDARVRVEELEVLAKRFMGALAANGFQPNDEVGALVAEAKQVAAAASNGSDGVAEVAADSGTVGWADPSKRPSKGVIAAMYTEAMERMLEHGPSGLARDVNDRKGAGAALPPVEAARLEVLEVFVEELF